MYERIVPCIKFDIKLKKKKLARNSFCFSGVYYVVRIEAAWLKPRIPNEFQSQILIYYTLGLLILFLEATKNMEIIESL